MGTISRKSNAEKIVAYISVFKQTKDIGQYDNQHYVDAINSLKAKLKDPQNTEAHQGECESKILSEGAVQVLSDILVDLLSQENQLKIKGKFTKNKFEIISRTLDGLNILVESSEQIAKAPIQEDGEWKLLSNLKTLLIYLRNDVISRETSEFEDAHKFLQQVIVMLYNLAMHDNQQIIQYLFKMELIDVIRPYMQSKDKMLKIFSFLFILYVSNEAEACTDEGIIKQLLQTAIAAVESKNKMKNGFKSMELLRAIERSSFLDVNKSILYRLGIIQNMAEILKKTNDKSEMKICLYISTNMAFIDTTLTKAVCKEIEDRVKPLVEQKIFKMNDDEIVKAGQCLNWVLEEQTGASSTGGNGASSYPRSDQHIMISYNWGSQKKARQIKTYLKDQNLKVWYDEDEIVGNTLQSMATAVEDAWVLVVCISRKYKLSTFCQMEAQYAAKLKRRIVPVRVESYEPDGWLGILTNTLLYYNFSSDVTEGELSKLATGLQKMRCDKDIVPQKKRSNTTPDGLVAPMVKGHSNNSKQEMSFLLKWKGTDLDKWFSEIRIDRKKIGVDRGADLRTLIRMRAESPQTFYEYLFRMKLTLPQITNFIDGFEELVSSHRNH